MIELRRNQLVFSFPEVHADARLSIEFQRTLRIPDDDKTYPLPPGLGAFPLEHVDDYANSVPPGWVEHGGVMLPMYQAEAMWLHFSPTHVADRATAYPFAIKVATGKIDAVTGKTWAEGLHGSPQDYMVAPHQPWLDGYCVEKGIIRQFVAMPLGEGYSAEEQVTGAAEHGGLQLAVYPMKREVFERRFPVREREQFRAWSKSGMDMLCRAAAGTVTEMGLAPGGRMKQEIYSDPFDMADWDLTARGRCFIHIANSQVWQNITGNRPPMEPPTAKQYSQAGLPWFDYYGEKSQAVEGSGILARLWSVATMGKAKGETPLPENASCSPELIVALRAGLKEGQVREGVF